MDKQLTETLWSKDFRYICISNFFLFSSFYILFPFFPFWLTDKFDLNLLQAGGITAIYIVAFFLTGPFYSYLVDNYKRKTVAILALLGIILISGGYLLVDRLSWIIVLRLFQGAMFGIAISMHTTLAIDTTLSPKRTVGNSCHYKAARLGMMAGILGSLFAYYYNGITMIFYTSMLLGMIGIITLMKVKVAFRAPIGTSLCSTDRFILKNAIYPAINLLLVAFGFGLLIAYTYIQTFVVVGYDSFYFWGLVFTGLIGAIVIKYFNRSSSSALIGMLLLFLAFLLLYFSQSSILYIICSLLLGVGFGMVASEFLLTCIDCSKHCQRGTSINTYILGWETGIAAGIYCGYLCISDGRPILIYLLGAISICISLLWYKNEINEYCCKDNTRNC